MKTKKILTALLVAFMFTSLQAADLLITGNTDRGHFSLPSGVTRAASKPAYSYLSGISTTDTTRLLDGYNEAVGGSAAIYSTWDSSTPLVILFDLGSLFEIESVLISYRIATANTNNGLGSFSVRISANGVDYAPLGIWEGSNEINPSFTDANAHRDVRSSITTTALASARYVEITMGRGSYHQVALGEVLIYGSLPSIPEPHTYVMIVGAMFFVFALLRRRF